MKQKIPSRMDGLDTQATWDTRHITNTSKTKTNKHSIEHYKDEQPHKKTESESKWSWKVTCLIVPILHLSTIVF